MTFLHKQLYKKNLFVYLFLHTILLVFVKYYHILDMINYGFLSYTKTSQQKIQCMIKTLTNQNSRQTIFMKYEKITTNFEPHKIEVVVNKAYLETEISKKDGHLSIIKKNYNEYKLRNDKDAKPPFGLEKPINQSEEVLFERAVKTTIQIL